ncbi:T1SS-143 repeat domain-containing protein [Vibrio sp. WXL210]|uniref:T1SS-143 repeat domain-containing protein n=1 Tax=Vibrio sp. WXL210 TaxID=3450709 RepID=UPI003EC61EA0
MPVANIDIQDGQDPVITAVSPASFDEANLDDGNSPDSDALVVTGSVTATTGSDDIARFEVDTAAFNTDAPIEALGKAVVLSSANVVTDPISGVVSYVYDATVTLDDDSVVDIFQVSIDEEGNYRIELFEPIDHEAGSSEDDQLSFNLPVFAVDSDGDPSESTALTNIAVTVVDDEATAASTSAALEVTEPVTSGDNATDVHDFLTAEGADGASVVSFVYQGDATSDPFILNQADPDYQDFAVEDGTVYIKTSGEMYFEPDRNLDHSTNQTLNTSITATIVDGDGDTFTPVANIEITDGQLPVISSVTSVSLDEANLAQGTSPGNMPVSDTGVIIASVGSDDIDHFEVDVTAFNVTTPIFAFDKPVVMGPAVMTTDPDTNEVTHSHTGSVTLNDGTIVDIVQVSFDQQGNYRFDLLEPVEHEADTAQDTALSFTVPVVAIDSDGNRSESNANAQFSVTIADDMPQVANEVTLMVTEPVTTGDNATMTHDFLVKEGADGASVTSFVYQGDGGSTLHALDQSQSGYQSFAVESGTVYIKASGEMYFEPNRNLDHSTQSPIEASVTATIIDNDGDDFTSKAKIEIIDGQLPQITSESRITLDEANLADGSDPSGAVVSGTGDINIQVGSDDIDHYEVAVTQFNSDTSIAALGKPVVLGAATIIVDSQSGLASHVYTASVTLDDNSVVDVFELSVTEEGSYRFELYEELDNVEGTEEDNQIVLDIPVFAIDQDGNSSVLSANTNIEVTILDDEPVVAGAILPVTEPVVEGDTDTTNPDGLTPVGDQQAHDFLVHEGADSALLTEFNIEFEYVDQTISQTFTLNPSLTGYQAFEVVERDDQNEIIVDLGTVYIQTSGEMVFEPSRNLDHSEDDPVVATLTATILDGDGDTLNPQAIIQIEDGQLPVIDSVSGVSVSEVALNDGTSPDSSLVVDQGAISATQGSDNLTHYEVASLNTDLGIISQGEAVVVADPSTVTDIDGNITHYVYQGVTQTSQTEVFELRLGVDGSYEFTLNEAIHHPQGANPDTDDSLVLNIPVVAVDSDGDSSAPVDLSVTIADDELIVSETTDLDVVEPVTVGDTQTLQHNFITNGGADGSAVSSITVDSQTWTLDQNDTDYQAFAIDDLGTAYVKTSGEFYFEPDRDLDHSNDDPIEFSLTARVVDGDEDFIDSIVNIDISDGQLPVITDTYTEGAGNLSFAEANLLDGTDPDSSLLSQVGTIDTDVGSDNISHYELEPLEFNQDGSLKSMGEVVELALVSNIAGVRTYRGFVEVDGDEVDVFNVAIGSPSTGQYTITLLEELDHTGDDDLSLTFELPVYAVDSDGDRSTINGETDPTAAQIQVTVVDDVQMLYEQNLSRNEGDGRGTKWMFDNPAERGRDNETGADNGVVTRIEAVDETGRDIQFRLSDGSLVDGVNLEGSLITVTVVETIGSASRDLGVLDIRPDGRARFEPEDTLDHADSPNLNFSVNVTAVDADEDTTSELLNITIRDRNAVVEPAQISGVEEAGRDGSITGIDLATDLDNLLGIPADSLAPIKVELSVDLNDIDRNEQIGEVRLLNIGNHNGTFYYHNGTEYVALQTNNSRATLSSDQVIQSLDGTVATVENLYFVPDQHFSTDEAGIDIRIQVQVLNNGAHDHRVNGDLNINIQSVADKPTFTVDSVDKYLAYEDGDNVELSVLASTLDTSNPETIKYELEFIQGADKAQLVYADGTSIIATDDGNNRIYYAIEADRIDEVQVNPIDHFSGQIMLKVVAIATEDENEFTDKKTKQSDDFNITIDVAPQADASRIQVNRAKVFEDGETDFDYSNEDILLLSSVVNLRDTADILTDDEYMDESEQLIIEISELSESSVEFVWLGSGDSPISETTPGVWEIAVSSTSDDAINYLEQIEVRPLEHSNVDFTFKVKGIVRDTADLSDENSALEVSEREIGEKTVFVDIKGVADTPDIVLNNQPGETEWSFIDGDANNGLETTIDENGAALLNFSAISTDTDGSEDVTIVLSDIPEGVEVTDKDGVPFSLLFVGFDDNGQPIYQADIAEEKFDSGIKIIPIDSSTTNFSLTATVVVTETTDGHSRAFDRELRVHVAPVVDEADYSRNLNGLEDSLTNINWAPPGVDEHEVVAGVTVSGIPDGATVFVGGSDVSGDVVAGSLTLSPSGQTEAEFSTAVQASDYIQIQLPEDVTTDYQLTTSATIKEYDSEYIDSNNTGEGVADKVVTGTLNVTVTAVVEDENAFVTTDANGSPSATVTSVISSADGELDFSANTSAGGEAGAYVVAFNDTDLDSDELVSEIIVDLQPELYLGISKADYELAVDTLPSDRTPEQQQWLDDASDFLDQFYLYSDSQGAINNGNGTWTITDINNFSIKAPNGLADIGAATDNALTADHTSWDIQIYTIVTDSGEDGESDSASQEIDPVPLRLEFPTSISGASTTAATIVADANVVVQGMEDSRIDLSDALFSADNGLLSVSTFDGVADDLTIVINSDQLPPGFQVQGFVGDFVDGVYMLQTSVDSSGSIVSVAGLGLIPPEDFAGDVVIPFSVVTTDSQTGDENVVDLELPLAIYPQVDVSATGQAQDSDTSPVFDVSVTQTLGLDGQKQPTDLNSSTPITDGIAYEDGLIELDLSFELADSDTSLSRGQESLTQVTLTVDSAMGSFVQFDSANVKTSSQTLTFDSSEVDIEAALASVLFEPAPDFPGSIEGETDEDIIATFNDVVIDISGKIEDRVTFDTQDPAMQFQAEVDADSQASIDGQTLVVERDFSDVSVTFDVMPVVDDLVLTSSLSDNDGNILVEGSEDEWISFGQGGQGLQLSLGDTDGSERFISIKLTGVPEDFLVRSTSSDYEVKNLSEGEWSIRLKANPDDTTPSLDAIEIKPAEQFSGEVTMGVTAFVEEQLTEMPEQLDTSFVLKVNPVADMIDTDVSTETFMIDEGGSVDIELNISLVDTLETLGDSLPDYEENGPEQIRVTVNNVPYSASITIGSETLTQEDLTGMQSLVFDVPQGTLTLDNMTFLAGDANSDNWDGQLSITMEALDIGLDGTVSAGSDAEVGLSVTETVNVVVTAINDRPEITVTQPDAAQEDVDVPLSGFSLADIDGTLDDPDADYDLTITAPHGNLVVGQNNPVLSGVMVVSGDGSPQLLLRGSVADLNSFISDGKIVYDPVDDFYGSVDITLQVDDMGNHGLIDPTNPDTQSLSEVATLTLSLDAINDTPVISKPTSTVVINDSTEQRITGLSVADVDYQGDYADDSMMVTLSVSSGTLSVLSNDPDVTVEEQLNGDIVMTGAPEAINAVLGSTADGEGVFIDASEVDVTTVELSITANDQGVYYDPSGMALEASDTLTITVNQVNDSPTLSIDPSMNYARQVYASRSAASQGIALAGLVAMLVDSREVLSLEITGVPDAASLTSSNANVSVSENAGVWTLTSADPSEFENLEGISVEFPAGPSSDGVYSLEVVAVSEESDGSIAKSESETISISVGPGNFDQSDQSDDVWVIGRGGTTAATLVGGEGDDVIEGGLGNDILTGGFGDDLLIGGEGADTFRWTETSVSQGSVDTIADFDTSQGDVIDLRDVISDLQDDDLLAEALDHIAARVVDGNIELDITTDDDVQQTIVVENAASQVDFTGVDLNNSDEIVNTLLANNIIQHGL